MKKKITYLFLCLIILFILDCSHLNNNINSKKTFHSNQDTITIYETSTSVFKQNFIPNEVFKKINLKYLSIQGMDCDHDHLDKNGGKIVDCWAIIEIPSKIKRLKKLETLILNVNTIKTIPKEIRELQNLKTIDMSDNTSLNDITVITTLVNLEILNLYGCELTKLPTDIGNLKKLKYLGIIGNYIDSLEYVRIKNALPNCEIIYNKYK